MKNFKRAIVFILNDKSNPLIIKNYKNVNFFLNLTKIYFIIFWSYFLTIMLFYACSNTSIYIKVNAREIVGRIKDRERRKNFRAWRQILYEGIVFPLWVGCNKDYIKMSQCVTHFKSHSHVILLIKHCNWTHLNEWGYFLYGSFSQAKHH